MGNRSSLIGIFTKYSLLEFLYTIVILLVYIMSFQLLIKHEFIYRADFAEKQVAATQADFFAGKISEDTIPYFYTYQSTREGKTLQTIPDRYNSLIAEAKQYGESRTPSFIAPLIFVYSKQGETELVLSYHLASAFANKEISRFIPSAEFIILIVFLLIWITGFVLLIRRCVYKLRIELDKVSLTNEYIKNMNLDYERQSSKVREVQDILQSMDTMSSTLKQAFQEQWRAQRSQKEMVQSVTHDIRTPITLIKGNLDLLEETHLSNKQVEHVQDLTNGVRRLEQYVERLKEISGMTKHESTYEPIGEDVLARWVHFIGQLTRNANMQLQILRQDESDQCVDVEQWTSAIQNVVMNSVEASQPKGLITLSFEQLSSAYQITVMDQGTGFDDQALQEAATRFFSTKSEEEHHGLGLSNVAEMLHAAGGELILSNYYENGRVSGAQVTMLLPRV